MRKLPVILTLFLLITYFPQVSGEIEPYLYEPTVPDTSFVVLALYESGDYGRVLEGCEWLMVLKTPFDSWGYAYGERHEAKYTAMAMMALMRGENIARGRYTGTINNAAYWLIFEQNADGSWDDYLDTALSLIALKEFLNGYVNESLPGMRNQVEEATKRALAWLMEAEPTNDVDRIFGYLALGKKDELKNMKVSGELKAYRAFALAYLGESLELGEDFQTPMGVAMALYATGNAKYREKLLQMEHFGFWGTLHYRVLDLLSVSKIGGFENLRQVACPYLDKIAPGEDWEKVNLAEYYVLCGKKPELPSNLSELLPWQVAEVARIKALTGENYSGEVNYLLSLQKNGTWGDVYNTAYVIWVLRELNVTYDYSSSLSYLYQNLTWMTDSVDEKTGNPVYYNKPTYYFSQLAVVFEDFGMEEGVEKILEVLEERQYDNGAFAYTHGSVAGITTTSRVLWNLQEGGLTDTELYKKGVAFLRDLLYAELPDWGPVLENATFIMIKEGRYVGNTTGSVNPDGLDGYVVIYPSESPLAIKSIQVEGFKAKSPHNAEKSTQKLIALVGIVLIGGGFLGWKFLGRR